ncbi:ROK family transcriptional regulator [Cellulomonas marina]|uniref:Sugar kinase of the NBD/HSP70 family, may contain an N-terminal HTH domain n=1 Tax=Cellulomonas marina TaxID=988821 RepID=A0A1I0Z345_9CELL|nr:ROK family transcriptional regulator [Cellulomonas marina]GIG28196.1 ROK family protein [Cellulomonas marina]SFB19747.1 Sugar kinase of the NBD/HSP70 family, may contain an N-terminal HTH domain [Cellulomonas marina]
MTTATLRPRNKLLPEHARVQHRSMVLQRLFHGGPASRADLARATGLTRVTVSDLVGSLLTEGLVAELGPSAGGRVGKPATLLGLRTEAFQIVALDLTDDAVLRGGVLDLAGRVVARGSRDARDLTGPAAQEAVLALAAELVDAASRPVLGVGVASPGVVDDEGRVLQAPNRGWVDVPLAGDLQAALGVPVHVANDANAAALGELTYGGAAGDGLLVVTVGLGVGAGTVLGGVLVQGDRHAAGELGHVTALDERDTATSPIGAPRPCACGRTGCLETVLSVPALRARVAGLDGTARAEALAAVGRRLGVVLAPVLSALDLQEVVLAGPADLLAGPLLDAALAAVQDRTMPVIGGGLRLRMTSLGEDGALSGAAVLVLSGQLGVS